MEDSIGFRLGSLNNQIKRKINHMPVFQEYELRGGYGYVMHYLYDNQDKDIYQKDIEEKMSIRKSSVTNLLINMEKAGYIERKQTHYDARFKKVVLTAKGKQVHEEITKGIMMVEKKCMEGFSQEEKDKLFELLAKLQSNIEKI